MHGRAVLLVSFFLSSGLANYADIRLPNQYARISESATIMCLLPRSQSYQMFRLMRGETNVFSILNLPSQCSKAAAEPPAMKPSFRGGYSRYSATNHSVAIVINAREIHNGHYKCVFMDGTMDYVSGAGKLTVGKLAFVDSLTVKPKIVIQGSLLKVTCIGSKGLSDGTMKIYSKNQIVEAQETVVTTLDGTPLTKLSAHLQAPKDSTEETFTCRSNNILNEKRKDVVQDNEMTVTVPIYHPPYNIKILPKKRHYTNRDILTCYGNGHPAVTLKWLVKLSIPGQEIKEFAGKHLKLANLTAGKVDITCIAENTIGNKKYSDREIINLEQVKGGFVNINFHQSATSTKAANKGIPPASSTESTKRGIRTAVRKHSSFASSTESAKKTVTPSKTTAATSAQLVSTPSLQSQTTQFGFMPMAKNDKSMSTAKNQNVTQVVEPKRELTKTDRRYENVILYLKLSISFNLVFGIAILFTMIGLCLRVSNFMK